MSEYTLSPEPWPKIFQLESLSPKSLDQRQDHGEAVEHLKNLFAGNAMESGLGVGSTTTTEEQFWDVGICKSPRISLGSLEEGSCC